MVETVALQLAYRSKRLGLLLHGNTLWTPRRKSPAWGRCFSVLPAGRGNAPVQVCFCHDNKVAPSPKIARSQVCNNLLSPLNPRFTEFFFPHFNIRLFPSTACSTVLVPARVMQALNLNLDDMYVQRVQPQQLQSRPPPVSNAVKNNGKKKGHLWKPSFLQTPFHFHHFYWS